MCHKYSPKAREMKLFQFVLTACFLMTSCYCINSNYKNFENLFSNLTSFSKLVSATKAATLKVFSIYASSANVISNNKMSQNVGTFIQQIYQIFSTNPHAAFRHFTSSSISLYSGSKIRFAILVIRNFEEFQEIYDKIPPTDNFWRSAYLVVILVDGEISEIENIFSLLWKYQSNNVNVMFDDGTGDILVKTFIPFSDKNCSNTSPVLINKFVNETFSSDDFFPNKMLNLHNCPIRVTLSNSSEPAVIAQLLPNGTYKLSGSDIKIIQAISENLNFSLNFTFIGSESFIYEKGARKSVLSMIDDGEADLSISDWWLKFDRMKVLDTTIPYHNDKMVMVIPRGQSFTSIDKLILPFDPLVWVLVLAVFIIGFTVISIVRRRSKVTQNFVFGLKFRHPYLNMIIGFVGGTQPVLPKRNFARFLLMTFLMYSLVMRTLYQGSYYKILKSNKNHKIVQSIDEMIEKDFKFYLPPDIADMFRAAGALKHVTDRFVDENC